MSTSYRPEQIRAADIVRAFTSDLVQMEYPVTNLQPFDTLSVRFCQLDIAVLPRTDSPAGTAIRLQGEYHERRLQRQKDATQRYVLEHNGWEVIDFWFYAMPNLWSKERSPEIERKTIKEVLMLIDDARFLQKNKKNK